MAFCGSLKLIKVEGIDSPIFVWYHNCKLASSSTTIVMRNFRGVFVRIYRANLFWASTGPPAPIVVVMPSLFVVTGDSWSEGKNSGRSTLSIGISGNRTRSANFIGGWKCMRLAYGQQSFLQRNWVNCVPKYPGKYYSKRLDWQTKSGESKLTVGLLRPPIQGVQQSQH